MTPFATARRILSIDAVAAFLVRVRAVVSVPVKPALIITTEAAVSSSDTF
jgi:hypothetical protein